jgi:hypothetical protein
MENPAINPSDEIGEAGYCFMPIPCGMPDGDPCIFDILDISSLYAIIS